MGWNAIQEKVKWLIAIIGCKFLPDNGPAIALPKVFHVLDV